jgi:hypothetical protein
MSSSLQPGEISADGSPPALGCAPRPENADVFSSILQGVSTVDELVYLVSRDGKKFPIQEEVLKHSSDFFKAARETTMRESGTYFCSVRVVDVLCNNAKTSRHLAYLFLVARY